MILLLIFAFLSGIVTILSPCILPVLPIILSGSVAEGKRRPLGIIAGFIGSFTIFTLFLSVIVTATGIPSDSLRVMSVLILFLFGLSMAVPQFDRVMEGLLSGFTRLAPKTRESSGFSGGLLVGLSLGLLWTPCVGPILAAVISLALTGSVTVSAFLITLAYSLGTAIPMYIILISGRKLFERIPSLRHSTGIIRRVFGVIMILTSLAIHLNLDRKFQTYILTVFPSYGTGLTGFEDTDAVRNNLKILRGGRGIDMKIETGKPMNIYSEAPELIAGGEWLNSLPQTIRKLRGKVVLVDFWTYTCINCIRTLPYIQRWHETYRDDGLVVIGVHTPEFEFEKETDNVRKATIDFGLTYPVMQDNDYATWRAYDNHYWPAKYLIDKDGRIRYTHFGEGKYDESEEMIRVLLTETGSVLPEKTENPDYTVSALTPEIYLGYGRVDAFASPERITPDIASDYSLPETLPRNRFGLSGRWTLSSEYAQAAAGSVMELRFIAKDVYLVMKPETTISQVLIQIDGNTVTTAGAGSDVSAGGTITVSADRLYHLLSLPDAGEHTVRLEFNQPTRVFAFTFG